MTWKELELIFNRAIRFSFSKRKFLFVFPFLFLCGFLIVFFRTLGVGAGAWLSMSLGFLPVFLCSGILLATGIVLTRAYHNEVKQLPVNYKEILKKSWDLMIGVAYVSVPMVLVYLVLWTVLGVFYLLKAIPAIGTFISAVLSFAPFLLVIGSFLLSVLGVLLLFFMTPTVALKSEMSIEVAWDILKRIQKDVFSNIVLFILGFFPVLLLIGLLIAAATITLDTNKTWAIAVQWFFMMIPFCALLSPAIVFFFNFSAESYVWIGQKLKRDATS